MGLLLIASIISLSCSSFPVPPDLTGPCLAQTWRCLRLSDCPVAGNLSPSGTDKIPVSCSFWTLTVFWLYYFYFVWGGGGGGWGRCLKRVVINVVRTCVSVGFLVELHRARMIKMVKVASARNLIIVSFLFVCFVFLHGTEVSVKKHRIFKDGLENTGGVGGYKLKIAGSTRWYVNKADKIVSRYTWNTRDWVTRTLLKYSGQIALMGR